MYWEDKFFVQDEFDQCEKKQKRGHKVNEMHFRDFEKFCVESGKN